MHRASLTPTPIDLTPPSPLPPPPTHTHPCGYTQGLSGGQRRRLTLGVEIISLPDLIFLDEPTTGLDSSTALEIMHAVRGWVGACVCCVCLVLGVIVVGCVCESAGVGAFLVFVWVLGVDVVVCVCVDTFVCR